MQFFPGLRRRVGAWDGYRLCPCGELECDDSGLWSSSSLVVAEGISFVRSWRVYFWVSVRGSLGCVGVITVVDGITSWMWSERSRFFVLEGRKGTLLFGSAGVGLPGRGEGKGGGGWDV